MNSLRSLRVIALVLLAALALFVYISPPLAQPLRHAVFDAYQKAFPVKRKTAPVKVVLIDENAIGRLGQWPWPRTRVAELIEKIAAHNPLAIGLDIFFPESDRYSPAAVAAEMPVIPSTVRRILEDLPSNDERLAQAIKGRDVVLGIAAQKAKDGRFPMPPRTAPVVMSEGLAKTIDQYAGHIGNIGVVDRAAASRGLINSGPQDQVVRQVPLVARVQGAFVPALGVETFSVAVGNPLELRLRPDGQAEARVGQWSLPMGADGLTWLRFGEHSYDFSASAADVMDGAMPADFLRDQIVLVGLSGLGVLDYRTNAIGEFIPGVYMHAQVVENLYNGVTLRRPEWARWVEAGVLVACGLVMIALLPRLSAFVGINIVFGLLVVIAGASLIAFLYFSLLLDPAWPAIGTVAVFGSIVVGTLSETERQRRQLREEAAHMAGEVDAARRIQMGLLPDPDEVLAHDRRFELAAMLEPARTVGGDFYDCFMVDVRRLFFIVADVSGKGLPAALFMAAAKSHIKSAALREADLGEVLTHAQDEIARENPEQLFVTAFAGLLDVQTGLVVYVNAGHEPPFRRRPDGAPERFALPGGPPLCVVEEFDYAAEQVQLEAGEWLVVVTDGVTEAMNPSREFFGLERLRTLLAWMPRETGARELLRRLDAELKKFAAGAEAADDVTVLALRWMGPLAH